MTSSIAGRRVPPGSLYRRPLFATTAIGEALAGSAEPGRRQNIKVTLIQAGMAGTDFFENRPANRALGTRHRPHDPGSPRPA